MCATMLIQRAQSSQTPETYSSFFCATSSYYIWAYPNLDSAATSTVSTASSDSIAVAATSREISSLSTESSTTPPTSPAISSTASQSITATNTASPSPAPEGYNAAAIGGGVGGAVGGALLIGGLAWLLIRRKRKHPKDTTPELQH